MPLPDAMATGAAAKWLKWYQRFVWIGIFANVVITLTAIVCTEWVIESLRLDQAYPLVWPRFGAFGILLLTGFYLIAAMDPRRSRWATVFTVICRFGGFFFFALVGGRYIAFGLFDLLFGAPQAICLYLAWRRAKDEALGRPPGGRWVVAAMIVATLAAFVWGGMQFAMKPILRAYTDDTEFFKYGSIGNDGDAGLPYAIWVALPQVCSQHLPPGSEGYAGFGFLWDRGRDRELSVPVGFSRAKVGVERVAINCAICHSARYRMTAEADPQIVVGAGTNTVDIQRYQRFLARCADDEKFSREHLIPAMDAKLKLSTLQKLLYGYVLIPYVRKELRKQNEEFAWSLQRPRWGPGRIDPFNPVKFGMLGLTDDGTVGNSDMMPLWNLAAREKRDGTTFHWDGLTTSLRDSVVSSMLGDGMVAAEFIPGSETRLLNYVRTLNAPASPYKPDAAKVEAGRQVFAEQCARCHATAQMIPQTEVGTDIQRNHMWTEAAVKTYTNYRVGRNWDFKGFRKVDSYLATTLDGLWLSGPYLHNGSVPTLRDLLKPPAERPLAFVRGGDVLDAVNGGFVSPACDPAAPPSQGFCYDTKLIGNSNAGHTYGTALPQAEKDNLLAYLLTL